MAHPGWKWFKRFVVGGLLAFSLLVATASLIWFSPKIRSTVQSRIFHYALAKVKPHLPFTIQDIEIHATWKEFFNGEISDIGAKLLWGKVQIQLAGPLSWKRDAIDHELAIRFNPHAQAEISGDRTPDLPVTILARVKENLDGFDEIHISTETPSFKWAPLKIELEHPTLHASWFSEGASGRAEVDASVASFSWAEQKPDRELHLTSIALLAKSQLGFKPFRYGPQIQFEMSFKGGETLWGDRYLTLPLQELPLKGTFNIPDTESKEIEGAVTVGDALNVQIRGEKTQNKISSLHFAWKSIPLNIQELIAGFVSVLQMDSGSLAKSVSQLSDLDFKSGKIQTSGTVSIPISKAEDPSVNANFNIEHLTFEWPEQYLAVGDLNLNLPVSNTQNSRGLISAQKIMFRRLTAELKPTEIRLQVEDSTRRHFKFFFGQDKSLPLVIHEFPLQLGAFSGEVHLPDSDEKVFHYSLETQLHLSPTGAEHIVPTFCLKLGKLPAASIYADFKKISLTPDQIEPEGEIGATFFDGALRAKNLGFYDLLADVHETDFDLDLDNIRLDELGDFLGFGHMDGYLHAYAHDVILQAALPTHYDFKLEVLPHNRRYVEFSTEAMKNILSLVGAGPALNRGGFVGAMTDWIGFGGFRDFLGGYDILFAGLSVFSDEGKIMMETLEPPATASQGQRDTFYRKHKNDHFILYGPANWLTGEPFFKILLHGPSYPYILDATAMTNFVYRTLKPKIDQLNSARQKKEASQLVAAAKLKAKEKKGNAITDQELSEIHDDLDCSPPHLSTPPRLRHR